MRWGEGAQIERRLEGVFAGHQVMLVPRAALGLMAVLRAWRGGGGRGRVALAAGICHDVVAAILGAGCEPFFLDMEPSSASVPASEWERAHAAGADVALVVHLYGNPADMTAPAAYFRRNDCLLIEDAAQALGSVGDSGLAGGAGDVGLLSFGATKQIDVGGAALLFKKPALAEGVTAVMAAMTITAEPSVAAGQKCFRQQFDTARARLRTEGDAAAPAFAGMLAGYAPTLQVPLPADGGVRICQALDAYEYASALRMEKKDIWMTELQGSGLFPVGMGDQTVPWRYVCRLPGIDWATQYALGDHMRAAGLNVSHWYFPAHWMCGWSVGTLPGVERLAREVFQFWVDDATMITDIRAGAHCVRGILRAR